MPIKNQIPVNRIKDLGPEIHVFPYPCTQGNSCEYKTCRTTSLSAEWTTGKVMQQTWSAAIQLLHMLPAFCTSGYFIP